MKILTEQNTHSTTDDISSESWSIESAWVKSNIRFEDTDCFDLTKGTTLLPLDDEQYKLFPLVDTENKTIRIYDNNNRYIDFKLVTRIDSNDFSDYYLRYDDEQGSHGFICYATVQDLNGKILQPYKTGKDVFTALKRFWEKEDKFLQAQFDKLKYQEMGSFRKFVARNKKPLGYGVWGIAILAALAVLFFAIMGVHAVIFGWS